MSSHLGLLPGVDVADVDEALDTHLAGDPGDAGRALGVGLLEGEVPRRPVLADQVDDHVGVLHGLADALLVPQVERAEEHLAEVAADLEAHQVVVLAAVRDHHLQRKIKRFCMKEGKMWYFLISK